VLEPAVTAMLTDGVTGVLTATVVVPAALVQLLRVAVTKYVPAIACEAPPIGGFCDVFVNPFGPDQSYETPDVVDDAVKRILSPSQTGVLLPAVGTAGEFFTVATTAVRDAVVQPLSVAST
jgi:hypothetical protein